MRSIPWLLPFLILSSWPGPSQGGWGVDNCGPVGPCAGAHYQWRTHAPDPRRLYLYCNGLQVGGYDLAQGYYRPYDAQTGAWGKACASPTDLPAEVTRRRTERQAAAAPASAALQNFGVDLDKLHGRHERYTLSGRAVSKEQAQQALAGEQLPQDADRPRLTIIGSAADRTRVLNDLASAASLADCKDRLVLQSMAPEHWSVAGSGFVTTGQPTIYLQAADGRVLHRQDDYQDGAEGLALALRRANPNYDPARDVDLRKLVRFAPLSAIPLPAWLLGAGALYLLLRRPPAGR